MMMMGQVRIVAETEEAVRMLASEMGVSLTGCKPGRDGGWIGYGVKGVAVAEVVVSQPKRVKPANMLNHRTK